MLTFRWESEFKETEIGEIPKDWNVKKLYEIVKDSIVGSTPLKRNSKFWQNGTIPWLTNKEVEYGQINYIYYTEEKVSDVALKETNLKLLPVDSLILSFTASVGKVAINKIPITTNQQFISFILKDGFNVVYYAYYFILSKELIESYSGATPFSFITKESALTIPVPYPSQSEQKCIAMVLSWLDDLIENKKRQNEVLEKTAMAIFKSWFMDFEPFKDEEFVDSPLGKIPKGWDIRELGNVVKILYGEGLPERKRQEGPYPVIGSSGIIGYHSKYLVYAPSIVVGRKGNVGSIFLMLEPSFPIDTVFYTSPDTPSELVFYVYHFLKNTSLEEIASSHTAVPGLDIHILNSLKLPFPPEPIIQKFQSLVEPLFQKILLNQKEIMILRRVRDTLLSLLVFGELRVEEI